MKLDPLTLIAWVFSLLFGVVFWFGLAWWLLKDLP